MRFAHEMSVVIVAMLMMTCSTFAAMFIPGDANNDRRVNIADLALLSSHYGLSGGATQSDGDFNGDGIVNIADLALLSSNYGKSAQPRFESSVAPGETIDFGDVAIGSSATYILTISNTSNSMVPGFTGVSSLTLLDATFGGLTPQYFSIDNFTAGTLIAPGESVDLVLRVAPTAPGPVEGTLTLLTDQSKGLGVAGVAYSYNLIDDAIAPTAIPAPTAAFGGMSLLLLAGLMSRRISHV